MVIKTARKVKTYNKLEEGVDVIDLGAPLGFSSTRTRRRYPRYSPNPRLYPNLKAPSKKRAKRKSGRSKYRRPVPNSRLYRPQLARRPAPPTCLRSWPPPARTPQVSDTASRAALCLQQASRSRSSNRRRLVVTLPQLSPHRSLVASSHKMEAANRHSTSPECSDGNDASSAPSEFLAEFLSAIMRRQYAEALKYCHLILQYEPHNTTARGFYPLLQHKVQTNQNKTDEASSSDDSPRVGLFAECDLRREEVMQQEADSPRSSSCSSLELDSSDAPRSSRSPSPSRRTPTDRSDRTDRSDSTSSRWDSGGERSDDDNGNSPPAPNANVSLTPSTPILSDFTTGDVEKADENDNASPNHYIPTHLKSGSSLQRLRAQFACSIK